jgi:hypothetical protein
MYGLPLVIGRLLFQSESCSFKFVHYCISNLLATRRKGLKKMDCDEALPVRIVIDLSFEAYMDDSVSNLNCLIINFKFC